jgi:hypothetical protein
MCKKEKADGCPRERIVRPGDCSPKQIQECHGSGKAHPCSQKKAN